MFYSFVFDKFPVIRKFYKVNRNTVWGITDQDNILIIVTDGSCHISCNREDFIVNAGDIFFVPAGCYYERSPIGDSYCTMRYIHFSIGSEVSQCELFSEVSNAQQKIENDLMFGAHFISYPEKIYIQSKTTCHDFKKISDILKILTTLSTKRQLTCAVQASICLSTIIADISQLTIDEIITNSEFRPTHVIPNKLKKAMNYIFQHYSEQISLNDLSTYCGVSKQQLIRYFKQSLGMTPITYINEYKVTRAKELLVNYPTLLIAEIASELGFDNQYYFTKLFTKHAGESPSAYRYRVKNYDKLNKKHS